MSIRHKSALKAIAYIYRGYSSHSRYLSLIDVYNFARALKTTLIISITHFT